MLDKEIYNKMKWLIAKNELKDFKKIIETYRSEIASMQRNLETLKKLIILKFD